MYFLQFRFLIVLIFFLPVLVSCKGKPVQNSGSEPESAIQDNHPSAQENTESNSVLKYTPPPDPAKEQAFQEAALNGDLDMVENLIREGVNVNVTDAEGRTALMYASFNGHTEIAQKLIRADALAGMRDKAGRTALLYASTGPFPETVKLLLENNADPNIIDADEHFTPLMHAAAEGQLEVVKILLEYGADPSLKDVDGETAYMFAVQKEHLEVASLLKNK